MKKAKTTRVAAGKIARQVADSTDQFLVRTGQSAQKRIKARNRSPLRAVGKVALVLGAGAATAYAGRAIASRVTRGNSRGKTRRK